MLNKDELEKVCSIEPQVKFFKREDRDFGDVIIARNTETKKHYMIKEKVYSDAEEFRSAASKTSNRLALGHPNLLKLYDFSTISKVDKASQCYKIRLFYDYWEKSVSREIKSRKTMGEDFATEEMLHMVYDLVAACAYLEEKGGNHGDITPGVVLINDSFRFVLADRLKYKTAFPQNIINKVIKGEPLYISPEAYKYAKTRDSKGMDSLDPFKCDVFSLGLVLLSAGIMGEVSDVYQMQSFEIDRNKLNRHLNMFENRYITNPFICAIVKKMLEIDEYTRPTFSDLLHALPDFRGVQEYFNKTKAANPGATRRNKGGDLMQLMISRIESNGQKDNNGNGLNMSTAFDTRISNVSQKPPQNIKPMSFNNTRGPEAKPDHQNNFFDNVNFGLKSEIFIEKHNARQHNHWVEAQPQTLIQNGHHNTQSMDRGRGQSLYSNNVTHNPNQNWSAPQPNIDVGNPLKGPINFFDQQINGAPNYQQQYNSQQTRSNGQVNPNPLNTGGNLTQRQFSQQNQHNPNGYNSPGRMTNLPPQNIAPQQANTYRKTSFDPTMPNAQYQPPRNINQNIYNSMYSNPSSQFNNNYGNTSNRNIDISGQMPNLNPSYNSIGNIASMNGLKKANTRGPNAKPMPMPNQFRKNSNPNEIKKGEGDKKGFKIF